MVFFRLLSLRLKDTDTREDTATVGMRVWWGRGATRGLLPASSSSSFRHSLVSSSLTSRGGPSMCPSSWPMSLAFWWAFSTAAAQARCLWSRQTSLRYLKALDVIYLSTSSESGIPRCGKSVAFPHKHSCPASPVGGCIRAPLSQNQRTQPRPVGNIGLHCDARTAASTEGKKSHFLQNTLPLHPCENVLPPSAETSSLKCLCQRHHVVY